MTNSLWIILFVATKSRHFGSQALPSIFEILPPASFTIKVPAAISHKFKPFWKYPSILPDATYARSSAALPNILGIYFYTLFKRRKFVQLNKYESIAKRYGLLSYLVIVFSIILLNVSINYENASTMFSWMAG